MMPVRREVEADCLNERLAEWARLSLLKPGDQADVIEVAMSAGLGFAKFRDLAEADDAAILVARRGDLFEGCLQNR